MCIENSPKSSALALPREEPLGDVVGALVPRRSSAAPCAAWELESASSRRRKLWEISAAYHCAIIGTCLPVSELRRLARRAGVEVSDGASDYGLHHTTVNLATERNTLSELVHKALETRYTHAVRRFAQCRTEEQILTEWRRALARGEVAGAVWALMSHARASEDLRDLASQDVHMLSHQCGAASRADLRRLHELELESGDLRAAMERQRRSLEARIEEHQRALHASAERAGAAAEFERKLRAAEVRLSELEGRATPVQALVAELSLRAERASQLARESAQALAASTARRIELEDELRKTRAERDAAERELRGLLREFCPGDECPRECGDLAGRRVLCVGGRTGSVEQYRALVERWRGGFVHHDGGLEHNAKRLQALLGSADAVICAAGHVSHGAYYVVKRFCKQHGKPCVLLKGSGLASFLNGLETLATQ